MTNILFFNRLIDTYLKVILELICNYNIHLKFRLRKDESSSTAFVNFCSKTLEYVVLRRRPSTWFFLQSPESMCWRPGDIKVIQSSVLDPTLNQLMISIYVHTYTKDSEPLTSIIPVVCGLLIIKFSSVPRSQVGRI